MNIRTSRLHLVPFRLDHRSFIKDLDSDPDVMRFLTNGIPSDDKEVERAMGVFMSFQNIHEGKYGYWLACLNSTQEPIGWFHLRPLKTRPDDLSTLELGYRLRKEHWGKGYASEIGLALLEYGLSELGAQRICAHTMQANTGSQAVMKKIGMEVWYEDTYEQFPSEDKAAIWYKRDQA